MALHHDLIPYIKPAEMLAWMTKNPLLLEAYPTRCAWRAGQLETGRLNKGAIAEVAGKMSLARSQLRLKLLSGYEGDLAEQPHWQRIQELLQSSQIESRERMVVNAFARQCHASEWPWLIARMEEVITRRALAEGYEFAQVA